MLSPFSCVFFHPEDVQDELPCSTPKRSTKRSRKESKNPYSSRGLEKFSELLADLEEKRQKIYAQTHPHDISLVRFMFKDSNEDAPAIPIVIKLKDNKKEDHKEKTKTHVVKQKHVTSNSEGLDKFSVEPSTATKDVAVQQQPKNDKKRVGSSLNFKGMNLGIWRRPSYYLPVVVVFILVLLAVSGRSVAILCTSIGWYALPTLKESNFKTKRASKKKDHGRRLSDNNNNNNHGLLSSPKSNNTGTGSMPRSQQHGHQKSW